MSSMAGKLDAECFPNQIDQPLERTCPSIDSWEAKNINDVFVTTTKGYFIITPNSHWLSLKELFDISIRLDPNDKLYFFVLSTKKCYNGDYMRQHMYQYINYFCNYYDTDLEYMSILLYLKVKIDRVNSLGYGEEAFFNDLETYILKSNLANKVSKLVQDNYWHNLQQYSNSKPELKYDNDDAKQLYIMSFLMNLCIPLLTHYAFMHKVGSIDEYLLQFYNDKVLDLRMYNKLYLTAQTKTESNEQNNQGIWVKQDIRGIDICTHSEDSVHNIILNIMPKYIFTKNNISFNYRSINRNTGFKITDIAFEFSYISISSSKRDNDSISDFDKFESNFIRMNEGLYLQNDINCEFCKKNIDTIFGPFSQAEIDHYTNRILVTEDGSYTINEFQKQLVFDLFYRWFRDTQSINAINRDDYVKLIIAAKRLLTSKNMVILPYIISGKIDKLVKRKNVNKKEKAIVESSPSFPLILEKYKNSNITNLILSIIATIISSEFSIVDMDPNIDGKRLEMNSAIIGAIIEEVEMFILMC